MSADQCDSCVRPIENGLWSVMSPDMEELTFCSLECISSWLAMEMAS